MVSTGKKVVSKDGSLLLTEGREYEVFISRGGKEVIKHDMFIKGSRALEVSGLVSCGIVEYK